MNVAIIGGMGYVGLITGIGLACVGHKVICADIDTKKIIEINHGILPIYEKGLEDLLEKAKSYGNIAFTDSIKDAVENSETIIVAVGTPENAMGECDMTQLLRAMMMIMKYMEGYKLVVIKSTVPVGTCGSIKNLFSNNLKHKNMNFDIVSNPEFIREGSAVNDFMEPDRIVIGTDSEIAVSLMKELYKTFTCKLVITDLNSSEMIKYACNSYLAARLSFINEIAEICEHVDADISSVIEGMKYDVRIGKYYLNPGPGFGGPCLSKDIKALISFGCRANANVGMLEAVLERNEMQIENIVKYIDIKFMNTYEKKICILGLSFKAGTADTRNSQTVNLIRSLPGENTVVTVFDPVVTYLDERFDVEVIYKRSIKDAVMDSDCIILMTEWKEFLDIDFVELYNFVKTPIVFDTRNMLDPEKVTKAGFIYKGMGRRSINREQVLFANCPSM